MILVLHILLATLIATSVMTAFSYIVSKQFRKMFQEPLLLQYVMRLCKVKISTSNKEITSWVLHYFLGLLFVIFYVILWRYCFDFNWKSALLFGIVSGIIGILGWMILFSMPSENPKVSFTSYFIQLFIAHLFFAFSAFLTFKIQYNFF